MVIFFRGNAPLQAFDGVLNASLDWRFQSRGGGGGGGFGAGSRNHVKLDKAKRL